LLNRVWAWLWTRVSVLLLRRLLGLLLLLLLVRTRLLLRVLLTLLLQLMWLLVLADEYLAHTLTTRLLHQLEPLTWLSCNLRRARSDHLN